MKKIIIHWTAGGYSPNAVDKNSYHYLVDKEGKIYNGIFRPEDNLVCLKGHYAAHTGGGNTGAIGVAMCAMHGFKNRNECGQYPITIVQFEATMKLCANLVQRYAIPVTPATIMTHYEFGQRNPNTTSAGKIDITYLPPYQWVNKTEIGSFIRSKIKWYLEKMKGV